MRNVKPKPVTGENLKELSKYTLDLLGGSDKYECLLPTFIEVVEKLKTLTKGDVRKQPIYQLWTQILAENAGIEVDGYAFDDGFQGVCQCVDEDDE